MSDALNGNGALLLVSGDCSNAMVEFNSNISMNDKRIMDLYSQLDVDRVGYIPVEIAAEFYLSLEHFGLDPTFEGALQCVEKFSTTSPGVLTQDEFACLIWSIARW